jgi:hypothetical protein
MELPNESTLAYSLLQEIDSKMYLTGENNLNYFLSNGAIHSELMDAFVKLIKKYDNDITEYYMGELEKLE